MTGKPINMTAQGGEKSMRLEHDYTDDELLRELTRRGRLKRIDAGSTVPGRIVEAGLGLDHQTQDLCKAIASELAKFIMSGRTMPGYEVTDILSQGPYYPPDRRQRIVLIFVVDPEAGE